MSKNTTTAHSLKTGQTRYRASGAVRYTVASINEDNGTVRTIRTTPDGRHYTKTNPIGYIEDHTSSQGRAMGVKRLAQLEEDCKLQMAALRKVKAEAAAKVAKAEERKVKAAAKKPARKTTAKGKRTQAEHTKAQLASRKRKAKAAA